MSSLGRRLFYYFIFLPSCSYAEEFLFFFTKRVSRIRVQCPGQYMAVLWCLLLDDDAGRSRQQGNENRGVKRTQQRRSALIYFSWFSTSLSTSGSDLHCAITHTTSQQTALDSVKLTVGLTVRLNVCLSVRLSVRLTVRLDVRLTVHLTVRLTVCLSVWLSISRSISM